MSQEGFRRLEAEIRRARAEALGRAGERLDEALARLAAVERELDRVRAEAAETPGRGRRLAAGLAARERARRDAERLRHFLLIQREALGLIRHGVVDEFYRLPDSPR